MSSAEIDSEGFVAVSSKKEHRSRKRSDVIKYDTRSSCPSDSCSQFSSDKPVMNFVERVSDKIIKVQCKWCGIKYQIDLKILPLKEARKLQKEAERESTEISRPLPPRPRPRERKREELVIKNVFDVLDDEAEC